MDLNEFGEINEHYGYPTGNDVLSRFARIATGCVRSMDWIARYGGDEFCLVMPDTSLETGTQIAERVRSAVGQARRAQSCHGGAMSQAQATCGREKHGRADNKYAPVMSRLFTVRLRCCGVCCENTAPIFTTSGTPGRRQCADHAARVL